MTLTQWSWTGRTVINPLKADFGRQEREQGGEKGTNMLKAVPSHSQLLVVVLRFLILG